MQDIKTSADVQFLVDTFYKKVVADPEIGFIFTEIAKTDFVHHLPIMVAFWEFILLGKEGYRGEMMGAHLKINQKIPLKEQHFERWLSIWNENLDAHFAGERVAEAKMRARSIADITRFKLAGQQPFFGGKS